MASRCYSVAFEGIEARDVDVQCQLSPGVPGFAIVGLPDKAVAESRERVRAALNAAGLALPPKKVTINLAPADMPKEGAHFDLPIALALLAEMGVVPREETAASIALGELALDGAVCRVNGVLNAALAAAETDRQIVCPSANGPEAALVGAAEIAAAPSLVALINHMTGKQILARPDSAQAEAGEAIADLADVKGQEKARRALEIAAAGGHNLLMIGPPGVGKSMLAKRLPGLLPPLEPREALELSLVRSIAGVIDPGVLARARPFEKPHHSASTAAIVGGERTAKPGHVSLAHHGVLFLDEMAEFARPVLESLRQPLEDGVTVVSRANAHVRYPSRVQLVAAMNPCRCGHLTEPGRACSRAPKCGVDYQARISGPLLDRIDLQVETPAIPASELARLPVGETTAQVRARVSTARELQRERYAAMHVPATVNADAEGEALERSAGLDAAARDLLSLAADKLRLSHRGVVRVLRIARSIADLAGEDAVRRPHVAEAAGYRRAALAH